MLGRIAPITRPERSPPSARAVASYVTATASAMAVSAARTPNIPTTGSSRRARKYPGFAITVYSSIPRPAATAALALEPATSQAAPEAISSLRSRTLPRGEAPARRGSGRPGSTHLAADHSPKPRPAARQRRCSTRQPRSSQPKSLKRSPSASRANRPQQPQAMRERFSLMSTTSVRSTARRVEPPGVRLSAVQRAP
jgi:hypothetical protein